MRSTGLSLIGLAVISSALAIAVATTSLTACTTDTTPTVYMELAYQVRCLDCNPRAADDPQHEIKAVNGEDGYDLQCAVAKVSGARRVTFSASHIDPMSSSTNTVFKLSLGDIDGDDTSQPCDAKIIEGANTYEGSCTSDPPSDGQPCQARFMVKDGVITGGLYCANIQNQANLSTTRYIVAPGQSTDPAAFKLYGCSGL